MYRSIIKRSVAILAALLLVGVAPAFALAPSSDQAATTATAAGKLVPIKIELPIAMFVGTPKVVSIPNLETPSGHTRPPFLAPAGARNLALHKKVTASDPTTIIGDYSQATDGDKEGADGSFVEMMPGKQWVQVDLGEEAELYAVVVWHFHSEPRAYNDVIVQLSNDPEFKTGVTTIFNNDNDNSSGLGVGKDKPYVETYEGRLMPVKSVHARYIRSYTNGNSSDELNQIIEIEAYGRPVSELKK